MKKPAFYLVAFLIAGCQNKALPWSDALMPQTTIKIGIQPPKDLSGKSMDEIMEMRKKQLTLPGCTSKAP